MERRSEVLRVCNGSQLSDLPNRAVYIACAPSGQASSVCQPSKKLKKHRSAGHFCEKRSRNFEQNFGPFSCALFFSVSLSQLQAFKLPIPDK
jgi:hypothetical protein